MRCDAMRSQYPTGGGGDRNIRIIDADSSFGGARRGAGLRLRGALAPPGPPSSPAPVEEILQNSAFGLWKRYLLSVAHHWETACALFTIGPSCLG